MFEIDYSSDADSLYIYKPEEDVERSREEEGVVVDYNQSGSIVGVEIINALEKISTGPEVDKEVRKII